VIELRESLEFYAEEPVHLTDDRTIYPGGSLMLLQKMLGYTSIHRGGMGDF
jgi:hypothetical protein